MRCRGRQSAIWIHPHDRHSLGAAPPGYFPGRRVRGVIAGTVPKLPRWRLHRAVLMSSLALMVRWENVRRRKGPRLKPGVLDRQLGNSRISYSALPDRSTRSLDSVRRIVLILTFSPFTGHPFEAVAPAASQAATAVRECTEIGECWPPTPCRSSPCKASAQTHFAESGDLSGQAVILGLNLDKGRQPQPTEFAQFSPQCGCKHRLTYHLPVE